MRIRLMFILLIVAALGYGAFWYASARHAEGVLSGQIAAWRKQGGDIKVSPIKATGFPYRLEFHLADVTLAAPERAFRWKGGADTIRLFTHPWTPGHLVTRLESPHIRLGHVTISSPRAGASLLINDRDGKRLDADMEAVHINFPAARGNPLAAARMQLHIRLAPHTKPDGQNSENGEDALLGPERADIALSVKNLALGRFAPGAPAPAISHISVISELHGQLPQPMGPESLKAWRDAGGVFEIIDFALNWGTIVVKAEGSLALDEEMRPLGAMSLDVTEPGLLVRYLADRGLIDPETAPYIEQGIAALPESTETGAKALRLPLTIQNGQILLGPIPIAEIGPVIES